MRPFNRIGRYYRGTQVEPAPEPSPVPLSDAEIARIRLARFLREALDAGHSMASLIASLHDAPPDNDWCLGITVPTPRPADGTGGFDARLEA